MCALQFHPKAAAVAGLGGSAFDGHGGAGLSPAGNCVGQRDGGVLWRQVFTGCRHRPGKRRSPFPYVLLFPVHKFKDRTYSQVAKFTHHFVLPQSLVPVTRTWCCSSSTLVRPAVGLRSWRLEVGHSGAAATSQPMTQQAGG